LRVQYSEAGSENAAVRIIVSVPDVSLRVEVMDALARAGYRYSCARNMPLLCRQISENPDGVLIVDMGGYSWGFRTALADRNVEFPRVPLILLLRKEELLTVSDFAYDGICFPVDRDSVSETLPLALAKALRQKHSRVLHVITPNYDRQPPALEATEARGISMREDSRILTGRMSRRNFLKSSAATAAAVGIASTTSSALSTLSPAEAAADTLSDDQVFSGACRTACPSSCALSITVRDGKVVRTSAAKMPDPQYNRICVRGLSYPQFVYSHQRLRHPMKRVGARGAGEWEQITWDEAIEEITSKWKEIQGKYGAGSLAFFTGGSLGLAGIFAQYKLKGLLGASTIDTGYDKALAYAANNCIGVDRQWYSNEVCDFKNAKTIICWGSNMGESVQQPWAFFADAMENGATLIVVDPNYSSVAQKAHIHAAIRPATDGALAMAMINVVARQSLTDEAFIKMHTVGPFLVKKTDGLFLRQSDLGPVAEGADDFIVWDTIANTHGTASAVVDPAITGSFTVAGIEVTTSYDLLLESVAPFTPEYAAEICDVPADVITEVARIYATETPSSIYFGLGLDHYTNAHGAYMAMHALAMVTGNIGKSGAIAGHPASNSDFLNYAMLGVPAGIVTTEVGTSMSSASVTIPANAFTDVVQSGEMRGRPVNIKALAVMAGNPLANLTDRQAWVKALDDVEFVVSVNIEPGDTTLYSDIVLPASFIFEYEDVHVLNVATPYAYLQEKAIEPLHESKPDLEIAQLLAAGMGVGDDFHQTHEEWLSGWLDTDFARSRGITYDRLKSEKIIRVLGDDLFIFAKDGNFPTPTGRGQFYIEKPKPNLNYGQEFDPASEHLPFFRLPAEAWTETVGELERNALSEKYPLVYLQNSVRWRVHTMFGRHKALRELDPEPTVKLSEEDAADRGIKTGDIVRVYNDRGYVVVKAVVNRGVRPGMVAIDRGWQKDQFIEGHYTDLTSRQTSAICINNTYYDCLCQVEKV